MTSARSISFDIRPSATLIRLSSAIVALATVATLFTAFPWYVRWPLATVVALYGWRRLAVFRRPGIASLGWASDGVWTVTLPGGAEMPATLAGARVLGPAAFLHLRWARGAGHVALLPDNVFKEDLRLLRARLATS